MNEEKIEIAKNTLLNILKELILRSDKYNVSPARFNTLVKTRLALEQFPAKVISGYVDISSNTHLKDGGLDYSSFTIGEDYFEIYNGFVSYRGGDCDDSSWEKVFSTKDKVEGNRLREKLELWAESFLLHLESDRDRSLLVIDRSKLA